MSTQEWGDLNPSPTWLGDRDSDGDPSPDHELHADQDTLQYGSYASSSMSIPGHGDEGPNCQVWQPMEFCDGCGSLQWGKNNCERRTCPNCSKIWEAQRTEGIVKRLAKARYAEDDGIDRRVMHVAVSAPQGEIKTLTQWYDGYREAYELAQRQGIRGGVVIGHGYRVRDEIQERYRREDPDLSMWRWLQQELPASWRDYTYWSPHYHVIGLCRDLAEDKPEQQDGWTVRRIRSLDSYTHISDEEGIEDMIRVSRYILDHATFETDTSKDCVRWFGDLATTNFRADEVLSEGSRAAIDRHVERLVGGGDDRGDGPAGEDDRECDECGGSSFSSIFDAGAALQDRGWCDQIGREQQRRLNAAFEWMIGERIPPPGARKPTSKSDAKETLELIL